MGIRSAAIGFVILATLSEPARSETKTVLGAATQSCGTWTRLRKGPPSIDRVIVEFWATGYATGANSDFGKPDILTGLDADAVEAWIDKFCLDFPLEPLGQATLTLVTTLRNKHAGTKAK